MSLNLIGERHDSTHPQHEEIMAMIEKRLKLKKEHKFQEADAIREELMARGLELIDTREGTIYRVKEQQ